VREEHVTRVALVLERRIADAVLLEHGVYLAGEVDDVVAST
jgi:hypothetical protein